MKHLLLTRFQGALIGGNIIYQSYYQISPNQLMIEITPVIMSGITRLTQGGKFDLQVWANNTFIEAPNPDRAIVAMLPLMVFFHDDRVKLREALIDVSHIWQLDWETCSSAVAISYIISRSLTESFDPHQIIRQFLDEIINLHPLLVQQLSTISLIDRQLGSHSGSLHQIAQGLATNYHPVITPTVMAIYCLISTPEDFSLATRRAYQFQYESQLTCALTGILAGAQNSLTGIPLNGDLATQSRQQWLSAAENLLNAWAGVYHGYNSALMY